MVHLFLQASTEYHFNSLFSVQYPPALIFKATTISAEEQQLPNTEENTVWEKDNSDIHFREFLLAQHWQKLLSWTESSFWLLVWLCLSCRQKPRASPPDPGERRVTLECHPGSESQTQYNPFCTKPAWEAPYIERLWKGKLTTNLGKWSFVLINCPLRCWPQHTELWGRQYTSLLHALLQ